MSAEGTGEDPAPRAAQTAPEKRRDPRVGNRGDSPPGSSMGIRRRDHSPGSATGIAPRRGSCVTSRLRHRRGQPQGGGLPEWGRAAMAAPMAAPMAEPGGIPVPNFADPRGSRPVNRPGSSPGARGGSRGSPGPAHTNSSWDFLNCFLSVLHGTPPRPGNGPGLDPVGTGGAAPRAPRPIPAPRNSTPHSPLDFFSLYSDFFAGF